MFGEMIAEVGPRETLPANYYPFKVIKFEADVKSRFLNKDGSDKYVFLATCESTDEFMEDGSPFKQYVELGKVQYQRGWEASNLKRFMEAVLRRPIPNLEDLREVGPEDIVGKELRLNLSEDESRKTPGVFYNNTIGYSAIRDSRQRRTDVPSRSEERRESMTIPAPKTGEGYTPVDVDDLDDPFKPDAKEVDNG